MSTLVGTVNAIGTESGMLERWCARLVGSPTVVLAEGDDPRVRRAANALVGLGLVPVLVHQDGDARTRDRTRLAPGVLTTSLRDLANARPGDLVREIGVRRGWPDVVIAERASSALHLAAATVAIGEADACVGGGTSPTGDVIRAGLQVVGLGPDASMLSSSFLLVLPDGRTMAFGDCAVVPDPDASQLADIAVSTARTFAALTGDDPSVAMLSFSTLGSAENDSVRRVRAATAIARERAPELVIDGEMQFDAAVISSVAAQKATGSVVAGNANVFIFPDLNSGNISYKIAQRLGGALAYGPIFQGLRAPMNDLSRGCDDGDVVNVSVISALQA